MKLAIFGASSATGKQLVEKALSKGHLVTAFVRNESRLPVTHPNLFILCGDALKYGDVESAVQGNHAVLSALGPKGKPAVMAAESTRIIVKAIEKHGVKRLVVVSVAGVAVPQDRRAANLVDSLLKLFLKDVFLDRVNQLAVLASSQVDWIAVRVPRLTNDAATGSIKAFFGKPSPAMKLSREDLADFMLTQLTNDRWLKQAPILCN